MTPLVSNEYHIALAARARRQARWATNEIARAVHIGIARDHEMWVGKAMRADTDSSLN